ncbi:kinase-like protein [Coniochaeta sp. PMI_546]|nr:kinase-like protein [Coniochaeta sp. PMI_546]
MSEFQPHFVGAGRSSVVFRVSSQRVVKYAREGFIHEIQHERRVLEELASHLHIIKSFDSADDRGLTLEYHPRTLQDFLLSGTPIPLQKWAIQIMRGIVHIHSKGIVHCDLNPRNILITESQHIIICDFASSSLHGTQPFGAGYEVRYGHPDLRSRTTFRGDIFSLGSLLYELCTRTPPYEDLPDDEVADLFRTWTFPDVAGLQIGDIITGCWTDRYETVQQALKELAISFDSPNRVWTVIPKAGLWLSGLSHDVCCGVRWLIQLVLDFAKHSPENKLKD